MCTLYIFIFTFRRFCRNNCNQVSYSPELISCPAKNFINRNPCFLTGKHEKLSFSLRELPFSHLWQLCLANIMVLGPYGKLCQASCAFQSFQIEYPCKRFYNIIAASLYPV